MPPKKRAAEEEGAGPTTRSAKAPKTEKAETSPKAGRGRGGKKAHKANIAASAFKARARPMHINITHTSPEDAGASGTSTDPGFLGTSMLVPSTFATGSYGWKGSKRFSVELQNPEGAEGEEKEKVHVMLTINATVIGSKGAKEDGEGAEGEAGEEHAEEGAEHAEAKEAAEAEESLKEPKETNGDPKDDAGEEAKD
ncbi:hypothetical protein LXA43DRAFT_1061259 [Ganoderma leucocontextum]|nr:hypothetical protein LXA43DRAFT_1061259 [Ganoderma leucocontextum]